MTQEHRWSHLDYITSGLILLFFGDGGFLVLGSEHRDSCMLNMSARLK